MRHHQVWYLARSASHHCHRRSPPHCPRDRCRSPGPSPSHLQTRCQRRSPYSWSPSRRIPARTCTRTARRLHRIRSSPRFEIRRRTSCSHQTGHSTRGRRGSRRRRRCSRRGRRPDEEGDGEVEQERGRVSLDKTMHTFAAYPSGDSSPCRRIRRPCSHHHRALHHHRPESERERVLVLM